MKKNRTLALSIVAGITLFSSMSIRANPLEIGLRKACFDASALVPQIFLYFTPDGILIEATRAYFNSRPHVINCDVACEEALKPFTDRTKDLKTLATIAGALGSTAFVFDLVSTFLSSERISTSKAAILERASVGINLVVVITDIVSIVKMASISEVLNPTFPIFRDHELLVAKERDFSIALNVVSIAMNIVPVGFVAYVRRRHPEVAAAP